MVGRVFMGRYEVMRLLGEGGMARVYLGRQLDLGRQVVIKVMHDHIAADPKFCERFQRETLLMARFAHPYAVTLYDACINDSKEPCIIMEYVKGITLEALLMRNTRLSPHRVGRLLGQFCEVLQAAHAEGIIHRDLKPANLMVVDPDTPYEKIKVMDFGLAKLVEAPTLQKITESNMDFAVGTPGYISPEQVRGELSDHRGDLYSVGIILYEMLAGRLPFSGGSTMEILLAHATEPPPPFSAIGADAWVPPSIEAVVQACLSKDPKLRPQSARDLAERYETALAHEEYLMGEALPQDHPRARAMRGLPPLPVMPQQAMRTTPATASPGPAPATPATPAAPRVAAPAPPTPIDPKAVIHHLEAWMPEKIAVYKLRGFVQDAGGKLVESVPGLVRLQLGGSGSIYGVKAGPFSWLGLSKPTHIDIELRLHQAEGKGNQLHLTVILRVPGRDLSQDFDWRMRCEQVFCDLRAYLMGASGIS